MTNTQSHSVLTQFYLVALPPATDMQYKETYNSDTELLQYCSLCIWIKTNNLSPASSHSRRRRRKLSVKADRPSPLLTKDNVDASAWDYLKLLQRHRKMLNHNDHQLWSPVIAAIKSIQTFSWSEMGSSKSSAILISKHRQLFSPIRDETSYTYQRYFTWHFSFFIYSAICITI